MGYRQIVVCILIVGAIIGCTPPPTETVVNSTTVSEEVTPTSLADPLPNVSANLEATQPSPTPTLTGYNFPDSIDPEKRYLFYLHGKIIEDQGIPAISPQYGEYEYEAILEKLAHYGFVVIGEQRLKDTDSVEYARKIADQVNKLLDAGVPASNITVVGASKGAGITVFVSNLLVNSEVNYVLLAICHPDVVEDLIQRRIYLHGNVLSIYDAVDEYAGSCQELFSFSEGKGISRYDEVVLEIGDGHGILYKPLDEWIWPAIQWAEEQGE